MRKACNLCGGINHLLDYLTIFVLHLRAQFCNNNDNDNISNSNMQLLSPFESYVYVYMIVLCIIITTTTVTTTTSFATSSITELLCPLDFWSSQKQEYENHLDITQQPCDDFYEYACGNWRLPYQLRMLEAGDTLTAIKAANKHLLIQYFEGHEGKENIQNERNDTTAKRIVNFYTSCLDNRTWKAKATEEQRIQHYVEILQSLTSEWPILNKDFVIRNETSFDWIHIAGEMRRFGVQTFIRVMVQPNWQLAQQLIFYMMPPNFEWLKLRPSDSTYNEESIFLYQRYIKLLMMDLGVKVRKANQIALEVIEFEKQLLSLVTNDQSMILREPQTLDNLSREMPLIDFHKYFSSLLKDFQLPHDWSQHILIVSDYVFLKSLAKILKQTNDDTIGKYMLVQFLIHFEFHLHDEETYTRQKMDCLQLVNDFLPDELSYLYLKLQYGNSEKFLKQSETHLKHIFQNLKNQFEKMLNTSVVFERDNQTRLLSLQKLKDMDLIIPKVEIGGQRSPDEEAKLFPMLSDNYDSNLINLWKLKIQRELSVYVEQLNKNNLETFDLDVLKFFGYTYGPLDVNAYYRLKKNAIELPIGLLRLPLYDKCLKPAKLYGSFVYILAHEMIHGFDYDGLNYDATGSVANSWGVKAIIKYGVRSNCYLNERYKNDALTINENIADSEGLRLALETFLDHEMSSTFEVDDLKLFFLSFAQTWCGSSGVKVSNSMHAVHKERVNNVVGNFMEFSDIYKCQAGSRMHPEEKCRIW
uniref:Peptidase M13 C-terminal domain-containing protein n=1 Tax=Glossina brevipalpis TaxID=37001 RepID=A0A1A9WT29_9MUSC